MDLELKYTSLRDPRVVNSFLCINLLGVCYFSRLVVLFQIWNITVVLKLLSWHSLCFLGASQPFFIQNNMNLLLRWRRGIRTEVTINMIMLLKIKTRVKPLRLQVTKKGKSFKNSFGGHTRYFQGDQRDEDGWNEGISWEISSGGML